MKTLPKNSDCIITTVTGGQLGLEEPFIVKKIKSIIADKESGFDGKQGEIYGFSTITNNQLTWYVVIGIDKKPSVLDLERAGGKLFAHIKSLKVKSAVMDANMDTPDLAAIANGFYLRSYDFTKYKTKDKSQSSPITLTIKTDKKANADKDFATMKSISDGVFIARDFVNEPPNVLYPQSYVDAIKKIFKGTKVKLTVFDEKKLAKMGAGALLAVGKGSQHQPRLVIFEYDGRKAKTKSKDISKPLALIGKGVTFDTGGYSLKPRDAMATMKMDMGGSAAVVGALKALNDNAHDGYVVGAIALAENMIAGNAYRVDDVLTSLSGQTIEVCNTDAEGRLCLADALTYVQDTFDPVAIIDAATLTGACMAALGLEMAGVFANNKKMETFFWESGKRTGDDFWPLPINKDFDKLIDSDIADMRNLATSPYGAASTAAVFLQRFITNDRPWAHLDIVGTAWRKGDNDLNTKGASGFGVRAMVDWVVNYK